MTPENEFNEQSNVVAESEDSALRQAIEKVKAIVPYNADAPQSLMFESEEEDDVITQHYAALDDDVIAAHDELREVTLAQAGKKTSIKTASLAADCELFDKAAIGVDGYDEPLPENWKELYPVDEKQTGVRRLLAVKVVRIEDAERKGTKKRTWSNPQKSIGYRLICFMNGVRTETEHYVIPRSDKRFNDLFVEYDRIKNGVQLLEGDDLESSDMQIPSTMRAKAELYDKIMLSYKNYAGRIPIHHRAAIVAAHFEGNSGLIAKK